MKRVLEEIFQAACETGAIIYLSVVLLIASSLIAFAAYAAVHTFMGR